MVKNRDRLSILHSVTMQAVEDRLMLSEHGIRGDFGLLSFLGPVVRMWCVRADSPSMQVQHVTEHSEETTPRPLAMHLAARLRELRARRGFTQDHVAKRLGCHESAVSRWESGSRFPTGEDLVALADLFEVSTDDLLGRGKQYCNPGAALVDMRLLERLGTAEGTPDFDR